MKYALLSIIFLLLPLDLTYAQPTSATYTVKGVIQGLPGDGRPRAQNEVLVKHEAIPDYRDRTGKVVGMRAMTMPFYIKNGVSTAGLAVGDSVVMTVEASWQPSFSENVVSIERAKANP